MGMNLLTVAVFVILWCAFATAVAVAFHLLVPHDYDPRDYSQIDPVTRHRIPAGNHRRSARHKTGE